MEHKNNKFKVGDKVEVFLYHGREITTILSVESETIEGCGKTGFYVYCLSNGRDKVSEHFMRLVE